MRIDIARHLGAVTRQLRDGERNGRPAKVLVASRVYDTGREDLWDALTSAERIPRWFLPVSGELRVGGRYQLDGNAGGLVERCEPPALLAVTWEYGDDVSWVEVRLVADRTDRTRLELEHTAHPTDEFWDQFGPGAVGVGWEMALMGLDEYLRTGMATSPEDAQAWSMSGEGVAFMTSSSDGWGAASVAAGTAPAVARARAARTTAFYTGD